MAEMSVLRLMCGKTEKDKIRNKQIYGLVGVTQNNIK